MIDEQPVILTMDGGVATVRLNRPDAMNAVNDATKLALRSTLQQVADDPAVRCVVLTGTGRAFCVGQDLKEHIGWLRQGAGSLSDTVTEHYNPIVTLLATMNKPVIAAVNGVAAGAGASLTFAADLRIVAASAGFNLAFTGIALSCDSGSSWWLPRLVGPARAKELLLMPRTVPADEALKIGLASQVVPDEELTATVQQLAARLAAGPTAAFGSVRRTVAYSLGHDLTQSLAYEAQLMTVTASTIDHRTAVEAFLAKQKPQFTGR